MTPEDWYRARVRQASDKLTGDIRKMFTGFDPGQKAGDHTAFVKYWVDGLGSLHVVEIRTEEVYQHPEPHFTRTWPRPILEEARIIQANRPYACPVRETRYFTMCHDGMRRHKVTRKWQTCEICQGFGYIE